jgi:hypothetical protein
MLSCEYPLKTIKEIFTTYLLIVGFTILTTVVTILEPESSIKSITLSSSCFVNVKYVTGTVK